MYAAMSRLFQGMHVIFVQSDHVNVLQAHFAAHAPVRAPAHFSALYMWVGLN